MFYTNSASFLSFLTHFSQFLPPFFDPSLFPFSLFLLYFSQFLLCFSHFLDHSFSFFLFLPVLAPFPFIQFLPLFSEFALLPFYLFLPQSLSCLSFFPSSYFPFSSSFHFPLLSVPSVPLLFTFQFVLLFVQLMSFLLCTSCLLFSVPISFAHFPFPLLHLLSSYHPSLFPNSLALPSSSSWCSVSSLFVLDVTSFFVHWDETMPGELNHWDMVDQNYPNYKKVIFVFTIITETGSSGI